jgi:phospholipase C
MEFPKEWHGREVSRRELLNYLGMVGVGALVAPPAAAWARSTNHGADLIKRAAAVKPAGSDLEAVEHIIFLMQENRSYDHYFGSYPKGRGFSDHPKNSLGAFAQDYPLAPKGLVPKNKLLPFHLNSTAGFECTDDLTHAWEPQHQCWNEGKMDSYVKVHTSPEHEGPFGAMTMGYYERSDLEFYYALADNFTLCDGYHASILGATHPNRLMQMSATIDPAGVAGGPITNTNDGGAYTFSCHWDTMPQVLEEFGVSWKCYNPSNLDLPLKYAFLAQYPGWNPALYNPVTSPSVLGIGNNVLPYFEAFRDLTSPLYAKAFNPTFPGEFASDVIRGTLPSVSWMFAPVGFDEHPSSAPVNGMYFTSMILDLLAANPDVWSKTALFLMYDENDGWFDHVPPPTAPKGTPGEYLTAPANAPGYTNHQRSQTQSIPGPLGLGVRLPAMMISPFSRGGHVASEVFDHTSQLHLISERFGVPVPNGSKWRRETVGDLTSTLFKSPADAKMPKLPKVAVYMPGSGPCEFLDQDLDSGGANPSVPTNQTMPSQHGSPTPASKYFPTSKEERAIPADHRTEIEVPKERPKTLKSSYNRLAEKV